MFPLFASSPYVGCPPRTPNFAISFVSWCELASSTLAWNDNCQVSPPYFPVECTTATLCTRIPSILPTSPLLSNPSSMQLLIVSCALAL